MERIALADESLEPVEGGGEKTGSELHQSGTVTLRRINDVPGSTEEQRRWHITRIELSPEARGLGASGTRGPT